MTHTVPYVDILSGCVTRAEEPKVRNPYRWLPRKEEKDKRDKKKAQERRSNSPSQVCTLIALKSLYRPIVHNLVFQSKQYLCL